MNKPSITLHHSIFINKSQEEVWDFTQDYSKRMEWDKSVLEVIVFQITPQRIIKLKTRGNTVMTFIYKLDDRPNKTTLAIKEIQSQWIEGGGGSWSYQDKNGGTQWPQTNTLVFKSGFLVWPCRPFLKFIFKYQMHMVMARAKMIMEKK